MESLSQSILINGGFLQRSNRRQWPKVYWLWSCWTNGVLSVLSERYSSTHCWLSRSMPSFLTEFYRLCSLASSTYCSLLWWQAVCRRGKSFQAGPSRYTPCRHTVFFWCRPKISLALRVLGHPHSRSEHKAQDFFFVVNNQMKFEPGKPSLGTFSALGKSF